MPLKKNIILIISTILANLTLISLIQAICMGFLQLGFSNTLFVYTLSYFVVGLLVPKYNKQFPFNLFFWGLLLGFLLLDLVCLLNSLPLDRVLLFEVAHFSGLLAFSIGFYLNTSKSKIIPIGLFLALLSLNLFFKEIALPYFSYNSGNTANTVSKKLPYHLVVYDTANNVINLEKYRNKIVYMDFWTTNCKPCILKLPFIDSLAMVHKNNPNIEIISLFSGNSDTMIQLKEIIKKKSIKHTVLFDRDGEVTKYCNIQGVPTEIVYNKQGVVLREYAGFVADSYFLQRTNEEIQHIFNENTNE